MPDLLYTTGLNGSLNNNNPIGGFYGGLKLKDNISSFGTISFGGNLGMEASAKEGVTWYREGNVGYNSEDGTKDYKDGLFANASIKWKNELSNENPYEGCDYYCSDDEDYTKSGMNYSGEVGLRFNTYTSSTHTNLSAVGEYNDFDGDISKTLAGKIGRSDGNKEMFVQAGMQEHDGKQNPFVGIGGRLSFGF